MSIGIGTLQPKARIMRPVWLAALLALFVAITLAVVVANSDDETVRGTETEQVSGTAANTPTELRGGLAGSFVDTPAAIVPHVPRRTAKTANFGVTLGTTTPSELRGGMFEAPSSAYEPIVVNGTVCGQCR